MNILSIIYWLIAIVVLYIDEERTSILKEIGYFSTACEQLEVRENIIDIIIKTVNIVRAILWPMDLVMYICVYQNV